MSAEVENGAAPGGMAPWVTPTIRLLVSVGDAAGGATGPNPETNYTS